MQVAPEPSQNHDQSQSQSQGVHARVPDLSVQLPESSAENNPPTRGKTLLREATRKAMLQRKTSILRDEASTLGVASLNDVAEVADLKLAERKLIRAMGGPDRMSAAQRIKASYKEEAFWSMGQQAMLNRDASEACKTWSKLHHVSFDAATPLEDFKVVLDAAKAEGTVDEKDANQRTALILVVQVAASLKLDDKILGERQLQKLELLLEASADIWLYDEDQDTALSIAHEFRRPDLVLLLVDHAERHASSVSIAFQEIEYMPLASNEQLQMMLAGSARALFKTTKGILGGYMSLSAEAMAATICASFLQHPDRLWWRKCLFNSVLWAVNVRARAEQLFVKDQNESDICTELGNRLELTCAAVLQELGRSGMNLDLYTKCGDLMRSGKGKRAYMLAVSGKCKLLLSQTAVLRYTDRWWRGYALDIMMYRPHARTFERCWLSCASVN